MKTRYTTKELKSMPTLAVGQVADLKIDDGNVRVWLSRCVVEDGEPYNNKITIDHFIDNCWKTVEEYI
jgi:uncharacterized Zn finger protein